jgi:RNA polymerase sigma factor (sigma-70 family)
LNFEEIYHVHSKMVFNLALQYVQNQEDAQEITQDVFVAVYYAMRDFKGKSSISTWIYRIAINKSLDFLKAKQRKKRFAFLSSLFYLDSSEIKYDTATFDHPGVLLENKEAIAEIFKYINELPNNQKTVLILAKIEQKPQAEVAEIMQLSIKAVESLLQRAKTNLSKNIILKYC